MRDLPTAILDNGAYTAKVGLILHDVPDIIANCIMKAKAERRRAFIGKQIEECRDASGLYYMLGFQRGFLLNWDVQKPVWDHIFSDEGAGFTLDERALVVTEPPLNFSSVQDAMMEILFEEYHCGAVYKTTAAELSAWNYASQELIAMSALNCIIVDVGYSFTHVMPFVRGSAVMPGLRRIEVAGKALTNHLKEIISYRHLNVMDESYVVNQIKEDVCFVSHNFAEDMQVHTSAQKRADLLVEYVLPDFTTTRRGYIRKEKVSQQASTSGGDVEADQQFVRLCNERFTVPELLFTPSDVGLEQIGVAEAIINSLRDCPPHAHSELLRHIVVTGGSALFAGFGVRLKADVRALAPDDLKVSLCQPKDPITYAWQGGKEVARSHSFTEMVLSKAEYEENGYIPRGYNV